jgi:hypothetical protein
MKDFSIIALGATTLKDSDWKSLLELWTHLRRQDVLKKVSQRKKYLEVKVF